MDALKQTDPEVSCILESETKRQRETLNLIASENYASKAVLQAQGSIFTNKYAEGYPNARVIPGIGIAFSVFIRKYRSLGLQHSFASVVFRSDQIQRFTLPLGFTFKNATDFGVSLLKSIHSYPRSILI